MRDEAWEILSSSKLGLYGEGGEVSGEGKMSGYCMGKYVRWRRAKNSFLPPLGPGAEIEKVTGRGPDAIRGPHPRTLLHPK